jgi:hypothetical protein
MVESESDVEKEFIDYNTEVANISYTRSIFKKLVGEYHVFSKKEVTEQCKLVEDVTWLLCSLCGGTSR